jgi:orotidine-5'-phosphate decarboxylase
MTRQELVAQIKAKKSYLCVGLDVDPAKLPTHLKDQPHGIVTFCKEIIDATLPYTVAYKPNIAFFEAMGPKGWEYLKEIMAHVPANCFSIADAKRGDIGNTANLYAKTFFEPQAAGLNFHSVTVAPYMGSDSVLPFLEYTNKWAILLALTSNAGAADFQFMEDTTGKTLFEKVIETSQTWGSPNNLMYVVGATKASLLSKIRAAAPQSFLLVPGVGAQGGSLKEVSEYGLLPDCGLLVNASRSIIYASSGTDYEEKAALEAKALQQEMAQYLAQKGIVN